jgi:hypothetical protein
LSDESSGTITVIPSSSRDNIPNKYGDFMEIWGREREEMLVFCHSLPVVLNCYA